MIRWKRKLIPVPSSRLRFPIKYVKIVISILYVINWRIKSFPCFILYFMFLLVHQHRLEVGGLPNQIWESGQLGGQFLSWHVVCFSWIETCLTNCNNVGILVVIQLVSSIHSKGRSRSLKISRSWNIIFPNSKLRSPEGVDNCDCFDETLNIVCSIMRWYRL